MKFFKKIDFLLFVLIFLLAWWAGKGIFLYNAFSTHDGLHHIARGFDATRTIAEGHFPLRWAGSLNYQCGAPIYNFFYPLIYYFVILINPITGNVIFSLKIIYFLSLFLGTLFFYLWIAQDTKSKIAGILASSLYLYAPYRLSLIFVRGSPEFLAYAIAPLLFYFVSRYFEAKNDKSKILISLLLVLTGGLFTISHNFIFVFIFPVLIAYSLIKAHQNIGAFKREAHFLYLSLVSIIGLGLHFWGPAILEKKFTSIGVSRVIDYSQHFPTLGQLFVSKWGYFYSTLGTQEDGMSFMLGHAHWALLFIAIVLSVRGRKKLSSSPMIVFFMAVSIGSIFLILPWSRFIWDELKPLQEVQFSWRFLGLAVFGISALAGYLSTLFQNRYMYYLFAMFIISLTLIANRNHLLPQPYEAGEVPKFENFEKLHQHRFTTTTLGDDVLPQNSSACWFTDSVVSSSNGEALPSRTIERGNTFGSVEFEMDKAVVGDRVLLNLTYFPGRYQFEINGIERVNYDSCGGRVCFGTTRFKDGVNFIYWQVGQTPLEGIFNYLSFMFLIGWVFFVIAKYKGWSRGAVIHWAVLIGVFALFFYFRMHALPKRVIFGWDQERDANVVMGILRGDFTLIGTRVLGEQGFFLPPYFFYVLAPFYFLWKLNPYSIVGFLWFYNLLFFATGLTALTKIFSKRTAVLFLLIWGVNQQAGLADIVPWNPLFIPLFTLLLMFALWGLHEKGGKYIDIARGLIVGIGASFHLQFMVFFFLLSKFISSWRGLVFAGLGVSIAFLPILIFDLRNNFLNLKLLGEISGGERKLFEFIPVYNNFVAGVLNTAPNTIYTGLVYIGVLLGMVYLASRAMKKFDKKFYSGMIRVWIAFPLIFALYGRRPSEYYFIFTLVIFSLVLARLVDVLLVKKSHLRAILVGIFLVFLVRGVYFSFAGIGINARSLYYKDRMVKVVKQMSEPRGEFNLSFSTELNEDTGFRYLLRYYDVALSGRDEDPLLRVLVPSNDEATFVFGNIGIHMPEGWLYP